MKQEEIMKHIPQEYRRSVQFCGNVTDRYPERNDIPLKPNVAFIKQNVARGTASAEELISAAKAHAARHNFNAVNINNLYAAVAVLRGVK
jgi:hypothetical protein